MHSESELEDTRKAVNYLLRDSPYVQQTASKTITSLIYNNYKVTGFVIEKLVEYDDSPAKYRDAGIISSAAVRWLSEKDLWWIMHDSAAIDAPAIYKLTPKASESVPLTRMTCPRCGRIHASMAAGALSNAYANAEYTHYALCPNTGQPIMLNIRNYKPQEHEAYVPESSS